MGKKNKIKKKNREKEEGPGDNHRITAREQLNIIEPEDYISFLPDEILCRIISFLPFESAVQTTFLSTRWKDLWKKALVLNRTMEDAVDTISNLLYDDFGDELLHRPRNKWGLQFNLGHGRLLFVTITPNKTLHLDFSTGEQEFSSLFDWYLPLSLPLRWWLLPNNHEKITKLNPSLPIDQQFKIKTLYLISASQLSSKALTSLVSNLSFLQSLTIEKCDGIQSLVVEDAARLENLVVLDCLQLQSLSFEGSSLTSFRYRGNLVSFRFKEICRCYYFDLYDAYSCDCGFFLDDAMLDFRQGSHTQWTWGIERIRFYGHYGSCRSNHCGCPTKSKCLKSILRSINCVKSLTICRWFYEGSASMCKKLTSSTRDLNFCFIQLKELWWIDCSMERENINALLTFLKLCPDLEKLYVTFDPKCYNLPSTKKFSAVVNAPEERKDLKFVKLEGFADKQKETVLARRLIPLFQGKPVIISKSDGTCLKHLVKIPKLKKKGKKSYRFEVFENVDEICLDHLHMKL